MRMIDLSGPEGNAYGIMSRAYELAREEGLEADEIFEKMGSSDYNNLLRVFSENFPHIKFVSFHRLDDIDTDLYSIIAR